MGDQEIHIKSAQAKEDEEKLLSDQSSTLNQKSNYSGQQNHQISSNWFPQSAQNLTKKKFQESTAPSHGHSQHAIFKHNNNQLKASVAGSFPDLRFLAQEHKNPSFSKPTSRHYYGNNQNYSKSINKFDSGSNLIHTDTFHYSHPSPPRTDHRSLCYDTSPQNRWPQHEQRYHHEASETLEAQDPYLSYTDHDPQFSNRQNLYQSPSDPYNAEVTSYFQPSAHPNPKFMKRGSESNIYIVHSHGFQPNNATSQLIAGPRSDQVIAKHSRLPKIQSGRDFDVAGYNLYGLSQGGPSHQAAYSTEHYYQLPENSWQRSDQALPDAWTSTQQPGANEAYRQNPFGLCEEEDGEEEYLEKASDF